jgi:hypothetical protein
VKVLAESISERMILLRGAKLPTRCGVLAPANLCSPPAPFTQESLVGLVDVCGWMVPNGHCSVSLL